MQNQRKAAKTTSFELLPVTGSYPLWSVLMQTSQSSRADSARTTANLGQDLPGSSGPRPIISAAPSTPHTGWDLSLPFASTAFHMQVTQSPSLQQAEQCYILQQQPQHCSTSCPPNSPGKQSRNYLIKNTRKKPQHSSLPFLSEGPLC